MREGQKTFTARRLRKDETLAEKRLWEQLRNRTLDGYKFVRQSPAGPYIADFMCRASKLIVEADGATHATSAELEAIASAPGTSSRRAIVSCAFKTTRSPTAWTKCLRIIRSALRPSSLTSPIAARWVPFLSRARERT